MHLVICCLPTLKLLGSITATQLLYAHDGRSDDLELNPSPTQLGSHTSCEETWGRRYTSELSLAIAITADVSKAQQYAVCVLCIRKTRCSMVWQQETAQQELARLYLHLRLGRTSPVHYSDGTGHASGEPCVLATTLCFGLPKMIPNHYLKYRWLPTMPWSSTESSPCIYLRKRCR